MKYAQTNLQLYAQLARANYSNTDILAVRKAYDFAMEIFTGQFRPTKKPFLCHLIGTASILVSLGEPIALVMAALLHASYSHGEFGDKSRGFNADKQKKLRAVVGKESENLIAQYAGLNWNAATILTLQQESRAKDEMSYAILTIRLADILEDSLDFATQYTRKRKKFGSDEQTPQQVLKLASEVANQLGHHELAAELEHSATVPIIPNLLPIQESPYTASFVLAPAPYRLKFWVIFRRKTKRYISRLMRFLRMDHNKN